jgi:N-acetylglucosamine-6-phosphate deacetylase
MSKARHRALTSAAPAAAGVSLVLSGATLVLPDRLLSPGTLVVEGERIADIRPGAGAESAALLHDHFIVAGFVDVHVHGCDRLDTLGGAGMIEQMAARLPRYGVTAFCPTTAACAPQALRTMLAQVREARATPSPHAARVLPAHLESNFLSPEYRGAQPAGRLRTPRAALQGLAAALVHERPPANFDGADVLREIERSAPDVGIVTLAPELDGGLELIRWLTARGHRVSLGHSGATYEEGVAAIAAGARHATHLFNCMPPLDRRAPGLAGAVLEADEVAVEIICDGFHVHPAMVRAAVAAKRPHRVMAITDGTAAAGLPDGESAALGDRRITARGAAACLDDGTLAGSTLTMDAAFRNLVERIGFSLIDAATMCATTPARELGLVGHGVLAIDAAADFSVLDASLSVVQTYVGGRLAYAR